MGIIKAFHQQSEKLIVGLMSGTSIDGIDAALVRVKGNGLQTKWELIAFDVYSYPDWLRNELIALSTASEWNANRFCQLNVLVAEYFAKAATAICQTAKIAMTDLDLIGSHGQTVRHLPEPVDEHGILVRATLQIGEPAVIANRCQVTTVGDFRPADLALGGQGAPLVPYCDQIMFQSRQHNRGLLNIGGIANFTVLARGGGLDNIIAFDSGPGNMLLDGLMHHFYQRPYDENGQVAQSGCVNQELLHEWMQQPYFRKNPPKTTGREVFGADFLATVLKQADRQKMTASDIIATVTDWVAFSVYDAYQQFIQPQINLDELIVAGGGALNRTLMRALQNYFSPISVCVSDAYGVPADAKEAICFAILANETIAGNFNNVPSATGANRAAILGKICLFG